MSGIWNGTPKAIRWLVYGGALSLLLGLSQTVGALEKLSPYAPVLRYQLSGFTDTAQLSQLEAKLLNQLTDIQWDQVIYRTRDLDFQISVAKNTELMLIGVLEANPEQGELTQLRRQRLKEVQEEIKQKTEELERLNCLIQNRDAQASRC